MYVCCQWLPGCHCHNCILQGHKVGTGHSPFSLARPLHRLQFCFCLFVFGGEKENGTIGMGVEVNRRSHYSQSKIPLQSKSLVWPDEPALGQLCVGRVAQRQLKIWTKISARYNHRPPFCQQIHTFLIHCTNKAVYTAQTFHRKLDSFKRRA